MTLEELCPLVIARARERHVTLGTAESLTGGMICSSLVGVSGASEVLLGGVCSYAESVKHRLLGVPQEIIDTVGVVSAPCASAMAEGARHALGCDVAVSATGVAGPGGGTMETPVGTVFLGIATPLQTCVEECHFEGDRRSVRRQSVEKALQMILQSI